MARRGKMYMVSSKQRSHLRGLANPLDPLFQVGKGGVNEGVIVAVDNALAARELIKLRVLKTCEDSPKEVAEALAKATGSDVVQVIGFNIALYRRNPEEPRIELP